MPTTGGCPSQGVTLAYLFLYIEKKAVAFDLSVELYKIKHHCKRCVSILDMSNELS